MKVKDFDYLKMQKPKNWNKFSSNQKDIVGWDTETLNGSAFLLCNSDREYVTTDVGQEIYDNVPIHSFNDMLKLLNDDGYKKTLNLFYNLEYDINAIVKHLPKGNLEEFADFNYTVYNGVYIGGIPRKSLDISRALMIEDYYFDNETNKHRYILEGGIEKEYKREQKPYRSFDTDYLIGQKIKYFDLWQFYKFEAKSGLDNVAQKYLSGEHKTDVEGLGYDKSCLPLDNTIIDYCFTDCELTRQLGEIVAQSCNDIGIIFNSPYSCATLSSDYFYGYEQIRNPILFLYPSGKHMSGKNKDIFRYAFYSYKGGRTEVAKRGLYENSYICDVNSQYPYTMTLLYDCFKCDWFKLFDGKELYNIDWDNIAYGFIRCDLELYYNYILPLPVSVDGFYIYGYGKLKDYYITLEELKVLEKYNLIKEIDIKEVWIGEKTESNAYPYRETIHKIFNERQKYSKEDFRNLLYKIILNSLYGRFIETNINKVKTTGINLEKDEYDIEEGEPVIKNYTSGKYFNPIYASYITAPARMQIFEGAMKKPDTFIASFTDSIISTEDLKLPESKKLGDWETEKGDLKIIGSGVYQFIGDDMKVKNRTRGFNAMGLKDFDFDEFLDNGVYQNKNMKLKESLRSDNLEDFNKIMCNERTYKEVDLNFDKKRLWNAHFRDVEDTNTKINSIPFNVNNIPKKPLCSLV